MHAILKSAGTIALAAASLIGHAQPEAGMANTVGELVRLEAQRALAEARKSAPAAAGAPSATIFTASKGKPAEGLNNDVIELLGIYKREREYSADVAVKGGVRYVKQGDRIGSYTIKSIGGSCVYLQDAKQVELLRCVAMSGEQM